MIRHTRHPANAAIFSALTACALVIGLSTPVPALGATDVASVVRGDDDFRVYLLLAEDVSGSFDEVVQRFVDHVEGSQWEVVGTYASGTEFDDCEYRSHVLVLHSPQYAATVLQAGLRGAFAVPVRIAVFEDERGINIGSTNPMSLNRTMVAEKGMEEDWAQVAQELRELAAGAFPEEASLAEYGQKRDKGRIGRTMGIMAGGPFDEKITEVVRVPSAEFDGVSGVATRLFEGMGEIPGEWEWQLTPIFKIDLAEDGFAVVGLGGGPMEARSFGIVGKGGDDDREDFRWPGLDHAPAYPVEVVIANEGEEIAIYVVNEMFRMKMYFENAGKMAFARNMGMPGSIEDELKDKIRASLD